MTWKNALRILSGVLLLSALALTAGADVWDDVWDTGGGSGTTIHGHAGHFQSKLTSTNWAGYVQEGSGLNSVQAQWTQPHVSCTDKTQAVSFWAGLDGVGDSFVEQVGVQVLCDTGKPTYKGFWETFPNPSQNTPGFTVKPGDTVFAAVSGDGTTGYTLTLQNLTTGRGFAKSVQNPGATGASAEVIVERPSSCSGNGCELPLADFGSVDFSNLQGLRGGATKVNMVNGAGSTLATTSGTVKEFEVTWNAAN